MKNKFYTQMETKYSEEEEENYWRVIVGGNSVRINQKK